MIDAGAGVRRRTRESRRTASSSRCCTACGATCSALVGRRLPGARLRALRARVVSVLHAAARRTAGQCRVRHSMRSIRRTADLRHPADLGRVSTRRGDYWFEFSAPLVTRDNSTLLTLHAAPPKDWRTRVAGRACDSTHSVALLLEHRIGAVARRVTRDTTDACAASRPWHRANERGTRQCAYSNSRGSHERSAPDDEPPTGCSPG